MGSALRVLTAKHFSTEAIRWETAVCETSLIDQWLGAMSEQVFCNLVRSFKSGQTNFLCRQHLTERRLRENVSLITFVPYKSVQFTDG